MREVECREQELAMQEYRQHQKDIRFYMQPYDHLTGEALNHMEALRVEIKASYPRLYFKIVNPTSGSLAIMAIGEVLEHGNAPPISNVIEGVEIYCLTTVEEKSTNEAIENRFGGNAATKKGLEESLNSSK
ncbi:hypothetical protein Tco_0287290 [Tanacetum coccineum]